MKLKEFNLEAALNGARVITRDGREVTEIHYFKTAKNASVIAIIEGNIFCFHKSGRYVEDLINGCDLFLLPTKKTYWVNVYRDKDGILFSKVEDKPEQPQCFNVVAVCQIEIEE